LKGAAITVLFLCGVYYINRGRKRDIFNERVIMYGLASLLLGSALGQMCIYFVEHNYPGIFENNAFYAVFDITTTNFSPMLEIFYKLGIICLGIGVAFFMLSFEIIFKRTKYLLTIYFSVIMLLDLIFPFPSTTNFYPFSILWVYFYWIPLSYVVVIMFYMYTKWSRLEFKAISSFLTFGFVLIIMGQNLMGLISKSLSVYPLILGPILMIIGSIFVIIPTIINPKLILRRFFYWIFFGIIAIAFLIVYTIVDIIFSSDLSIIISDIIGNIFSFVIVYFTLRNIKASIILDSEKPISIKHPDVLEMFTKPEKLTEEEVSISKEKKICLVCKKQLQKQIFLCSDCGAFYCIKCSDALVELENACWVCDAPFDDSMPSKPFKKEEEEIEVEEKVQK
jgi:hypothetical protein